MKEWEGNSTEIIVVGSHAPGLFMRVHKPPLPGETIIGWDFHEPVDGGKGSNQAIAAARLGKRTSFVGCVGIDTMGDELESWFIQEGIDSHFLFRSKDKNTGVGFILLDDDGIPSMVTTMGANEGLDEILVQKAVSELRSARVLLTQFEIKPSVALFAAKLARSFEIISIVNPAPGALIPLDEFSVCDVLIPNETEAKTLLGIDPKIKVLPSTLAQEIYIKTKVKCVIITLGEKGIVGADKDGGWEYPPQKVNVVDTSGAGDVFCAAYAAALVDGLDFRLASGWANQVAALSVMLPGTIPSFPTLQTIKTLL